jgi:hypothetical protein
MDGVGGEPGSAGGGGSYGIDTVGRHLFAWVRSPRNWAT